MKTAAKTLFELTATDLMTPAPVTLREGQFLREAADDLLQAGVHGAPVVDGTGRCVGVLSVSDLARWSSRRADPTPIQPRACSHQETYRTAHGAETTLCTLPAGGCALQASTVLADGREVQACRDPFGVCVDWQLVELDALPAETVHNYMTREPVTAGEDATIRALARQMLERVVQRVIIIDPAGWPVGIVSATDLVAALAWAEDNTGG